MAVMSTESLNEYYQSELRHIRHGVQPNEEPQALGTVRFIAYCNGDALEVLNKAKCVLELLNVNAIISVPSQKQWRALLPKWFVDACAEERTQDEEERLLKLWKSMPRDEQIQLEAQEQWPLSNWIYWFQPENRYWFWWDGMCLDENHIVIAVFVRDWPFPWQCLSWLFRACGAKRVDAET